MRLPFEPARFACLREPVEAAETCRDLPVPHDIPTELGHRGPVPGNSAMISRMRFGPG